MRVRPPSRERRATKAVASDTWNRRLRKWAAIR
nr:MAG TPA: hypothetical protein [Bacteriophage sp.]